MKKLMVGTAVLGSAVIAFAWPAGLLDKWGGSLHESWRSSTGVLTGQRSQYNGALADTATRWSQSSFSPWTGSGEPHDDYITGQGTVLNWIGKKGSGYNWTTYADGYTEKASILSPGLPPEPKYMSGTYVNDANINASGTYTGKGACLWEVKNNTTRPFDMALWTQWYGTDNSWYEHHMTTNKFTVTPGKLSGCVPKPLTSYGWVEDVWRDARP